MPAITEKCCLDSLNYKKKVLNIQLCEQKCGTINIILVSPFFKEKITIIPPYPLRGGHDLVVVQLHRYHPELFYGCPNTVTYQTHKCKFLPSFMIVIKAHELRRSIQSHLLIKKTKCPINSTTDVITKWD